ncbi:MAG: polysaccharide pyruvyl transferase family protein [Bacteroidaceae bacterium]|nr:polysaccharide pyruvyl transferase family protein [Bacteroidaceae bacterium]
MSSLDIKIITCHDVYNFGASLQVYALQTYLERLGHLVQIVDYKPHYQPPRHQKLFVMEKGNNCLMNFAKMLYRLPQRIRHLERNRMFRQFTASRLHLTPECYDKPKLMSSHLDADVFIAGSDQIWNSMFLAGRDSIFYLDFVKSKARKVAYAPSISVNQIEPRWESIYQKYLPTFDFVSVREKSSLPFLKKMGRGDAEVVCDPVLLFNQQEWDTLIPCRSLVKVPYLLVYDFDGNKQISSIARAISKAEGLRIINISIDTLGGLGTKLRGIGPEEFLSLVRGASFIVSSSYHATVFSLLYHKRFCVVRRQLGINLRLEDLVDDYGMRHRIVSEFTPSLLESIDDEQVDKKMQSLTKSSKDYLNRALDFES